MFVTCKCSVGYCCVPGCKFVFYDKNREKTNISLFSIPKREDLRKKWLNVLKHARRKGGKDSFNVKIPNKRIYVYEFHFFYYLFISVF